MAAKFREGTKSPTSFYVNPSVERGLVSSLPESVNAILFLRRAINFREECLFSEGGRGCATPVQTNSVIEVSRISTTTDFKGRALPRDL